MSSSRPEERRYQIDSKACKCYDLQAFLFFFNHLTSIDQTGYGMLEQMLSPATLNAANKGVKQNKGAGDVDEMEVESLKDYLIKEKDALLAAILDGKYRPNAVRRVEIPKDNGKKRQLGIPTVVDRVIQQAFFALH